MRIITGEMRGRSLRTLDGEHTRPTSEKVKEAMFSIIQWDIEGRRVLDLFAGSGQLGLEALSRGAAECVFVENDRASVDIVRSNIDKCGAASRTKIVFGDYENFLRRGEKFNIILIDPPYGSDFREKALSLISEFDILAANGIIVVESEQKSAELPETCGTLARGRTYDYGRTKLTLYGRGDEK